MVNVSTHFLLKRALVPNDNNNKISAQRQAFVLMQNTSMICIDEKYKQFSEL